MAYNGRSIDFTISEIAIGIAVRKILFPTTMRNERASLIVAVAPVFPAVCQENFFFEYQHHNVSFVVAIKLRLLMALLHQDIP
mgnify:CR=1 FL=1